MINQVGDIKIFASLTEGYDDLNKLYDNSTNIVLATITSINSSDTIYPDGTKTFLGFTKGKLLVLENLKGDIDKIKEIPYIRASGIITQ